MRQERTSFNPTMVRLLPRRHRVLWRGSAAFQSHNGAIAAELKQQQHLLHFYLSIPQWCDCCNEKIADVVVGKFTFNPTMVRLLPRQCPLHPADHQRFQSHNGAIAAIACQRIVLATTAFQSHNGAIAAHTTLVRVTLYPTSFNPTMVRLLLLNALQNFFEKIPPFNPTMVRLLLVGGQSSLAFARTFNPTMVRLLR